MIYRILTLIIKELTEAVRDPKTRLSLLAPPLIQLLLFTFAATLDVKNVPIGIWNQDAGKWGFELVQRFKGAPTFNKIVILQAQQAIASFMDEQKGVMVVAIPQDFSRKLEQNQKAPVELILDGRKSNTAQIVAGYASTILQGFNDDFLVRAHLQRQNSELFPRYWFNPNLLYYWYNIPSLVATLSMLTCLIVTSVSIAKEKELGTFDQLLVSPLLPFEIVAGKIIPGVIIGMFEGLLLMVVGVFLFQVPFEGNFLLFLLSLIIFIFAIGGVGLFVSSFANTQQQAMLGTFVIMAPSILLSGFATPIENMPVWLQPVSFLIPLKYMLIISKGIFLKDISTSIVLRNLWPLVLIALFTLVSAGQHFRRGLK